MQNKTDHTGPIDNTPLRRILLTHQRSAERKSENKLCNDGRGKETIVITLALKMTRHFRIGD
jgi:hypothetical protein